MWLPKNERKLLAYLYTRLSRDAISGTVKLESEDLVQCGLDVNLCFDVASFLASVRLLKADIVNRQSGYIMIGFTPEGHDLARKYSSWSSRSNLWYAEYVKHHWIWLTVSFLGGIIGGLLINWLSQGD